MLTILPNQPHQPLLTICDDQLTLDVEFEVPNEDFDDNVRFAITENPDSTIKMLAANEIGFSLTSSEARALANALLEAAQENDAWLAAMNKKQP